MGSERQFPSVDSDDPADMLARHNDIERRRAEQLEESMTNDRLEQADVEGLVERLRLMSKQHLQSEMESPEDGDYESAYDWFVTESRAAYAEAATLIQSQAAEIERLKGALQAVKDGARVGLPGSSPSRSKWASIPSNVYHSVCAALGTGAGGPEK